ncbi:MAG: GNAT family N-acetyltransferase [Aquabacterium sp.]
MPLSPFQPVSGPRVQVREVAEADLPDLMAVNGDDQVTAFLPYASWQGLDDAKAWLQRMQAMAEAGTARQLVMVHGESGRTIGTVLLFRWDEASARLELGYVLGRAWWGQGLAREAVQLVVGQAFADLGVRRIEAEVHPANAASNALLLSLGFVHEGLARERWVAKGRAYGVNLWGVLAHEWPGAV